MRPAGIYLVEAQIGAARITNIPEGDILLTLRIGRNYAAANYSRSNAMSPVLFNTTLQVNVDSSALDTQRCSLTLNLNTPNDKRMIGIALISLPKDKNQINNSYRLTQNEDKKAEIDIKIKITSIESSSLRSPPVLSPNSEPFTKFEQSKPILEVLKEGEEIQPSNIKPKQKPNEEPSVVVSELIKVPAKPNKNQGDKIVQQKDSEVKRYKEEKDVYYQMYQIQKSKNQVAAKFINTFIKKIAEKFPNLVPNPTQFSQSGKRLGESVSKTKPVDNSAAMAQLQQANRSLHRQIEEYKKIVEQLKQQLFKNGDDAHKNKGTMISSSILDLGITQKPTTRDRSNIIPQSLKQPLPSVVAEAKKEIKETFAGVDLKKWLEQSIGQREEIQSKFMAPSVILNPQERNQSKTAFIKKLRSGIDKAFAQLVANKDLSKSALLSHKQEVNRLLDENAF